jgi:hypothetical protein
LVTLPSEATDERFFGDVDAVSVTDGGAGGGDMELAAPEDRGEGVSPWFDIVTEVRISLKTVT